MSSKVFVLGLDGATFDLMLPWMEAGYLPNLASFYAGAARGKILSTILPVTAAAWTSFATGVNPGQHGLFDFTRRQPDSYRRVPVRRTDIKVPTLWQILSRHNRRLVAVNVPMTYPPLPCNGVMVADLLTALDKGYLYPASLQAELEQGLGYKLFLEEVYNGQNEAAYLEEILAMEESRQRAVRRLMAREPWDFFITVFSGTDLAAHFFWKHMDPTHPDHEPALAAQFGDAIRRVYQQADTFLGEILASLEDDTTVIVMSDHGFGPLHGGFYINNALYQAGLLHFKSGALTRCKQMLHQSGLNMETIFPLFARLGAGRPAKRALKRGNMERTSRWMDRFFLSFDDIDWNRTRAYATGNFGQIFVNLSGREPSGCVQPGADYEAAREEVIRTLGNLTEPETGAPLVSKVYRREDIYWGDYVSDAPDLIVMAQDLKYVASRQMEFASRNIIGYPPRMTTGTHRMHGVFMAQGPGIRAGDLAAEVRLYDLTPTILHLLGLPIPDSMDGRVPESLFEARPRLQFEHDHDLQDMVAIDADFDTAAREVVEKRLRSLGYLE